MGTWGGTAFGCGQRDPGLLTFLLHVEVLVGVARLLLLLVSGEVL